MKKLLFITIILYFTKIGWAQESTNNNIRINYGVDKSAGIDIGLSYVYLFTSDEIAKVWGFLKTAKEYVRYDIWDSKTVEKRLSCNNITIIYSEEWKKTTGTKSYEYFASDYMIIAIYNGEEYVIRFYKDKSLVFLFRQQQNGGCFYHHTIGVEVHNSKISNSNLKELREMIPLDILSNLKDVIITNIEN